MNQLNQQEITLLALFRSLPPQARAEVLEMINNRAACDVVAEATEDNYQVTLQLTGSYIVDIAGDDVEDAIDKARTKALHCLACGDIASHTRINAVDYLLNNN